MSAAHPLPPPLEEDLVFFPLDDAYLTTLPSEVQAEIRQAEADAAEGRVVVRADMTAMLEEMRREQGG